MMTKYEEREYSRRGVHEITGRPAISFLPQLSISRKQMFRAIEPRVSHGRDARAHHALHVPNVRFMVAQCEAANQ